MSRTNGIGALLGVLSLCVSAGTTGADDSPPVVDWAVQSDTDPVSTGTVQLVAGQNEAGEPVFVGSILTSGALIEAETTPFVDGVLSANFMIHNTSSDDQSFSLLLNIPAPSTFPLSTLTGGSIVITTGADADGGTIMPTTSVPVFTAFLDGVPIGTMLETAIWPVELGPWQAAVIGPDKFGKPIPSAPAPPVSETIGSAITVTISSGEFLSATWTVAVEKVGCMGDLNGDGTVDGGDLGILLATWGGQSGAGDLTFDGLVNGADIGLLLASWGPCDA